MGGLSTFWVVAALGSVWGLLELSLWGSLGGAGFGYRAALMGAVGIGIMFLARAIVRRPGIVMAVAGLAATYKLLALGYNPCHLWSILALGIAVEGLTSLAFRGYLGNVRQQAFLGVLSAGIGFGLFAFGITYLFRYPYWIAEGWPKILNYMAVQALPAAIAGTAVVPAASALGARIAMVLRARSALAPGLVSSALSIAVVGCWAVGWFAG